MIQNVAHINRHNTFRSKWAISYWWRKANPLNTWRRNRMTSSSSGISSRSSTLCSSPPLALKGRKKNIINNANSLAFVFKPFFTYNWRMRIVSPGVSYTCSRRTMCGHERHKSKVAASCNDSGVSPSPRRLFLMTLAANSSPVKEFLHRLTAANFPLK